MMEETPLAGRLKQCHRVIRRFRTEGVLELSPCLQQEPNLTMVRFVRAFGIGRNQADEIVHRPAAFLATLLQWFSYHLDHECGATGPLASFGMISHKQNSTNGGFHAFPVDSNHDVGVKINRPIVVSDPHFFRIGK
jgi:hypothetical protein